jgi:acetyltransferase
MKETGPRRKCYPIEWERHLVLRSDWKVFTRPILPTDEDVVRKLLSHVSKADLRLRFFGGVKELSHPFLISLTHLDYAIAMAFVAFDEVTTEASCGYTECRTKYLRNSPLS